MIKSFFVDAFTTDPFKGNPAGVCILHKEISEEKMLNIAREIGFSETAFVTNLGEPDTYSIRYFSPLKEIPLCGHATLASAKIIFDTTETFQINFITGKKLKIAVNRQGDEMIMEFPIYDTVVLETPLAVLSALGLQNVINSS
jgi:PhzF family phenazine biosynthesis protein